MGNVDNLRDEIKSNQRDLVNLKEEMSSKMDEGFKKEQQARQQIQKEIMQGFKNEENARQHCAVRSAQGWDWGQVSLPGPCHSLLDGMKFSFHERWNSEVGSQITLREAFNMSQTMKLRNLWVVLKEWCPNMPQSGLIGTTQRRNKEPGRGKLW